MNIFKFWVILTVKVVFLFGFLTISSYAINDFNLRISVADDSLKHFYLSLGEFFNVPEEDIIIIKRRYHPTIRDEEIPIILTLTGKTGVSPEVIIDLRRKGYTWYEIFIYFGIKPEKFYKTVIIRGGPPYGKAWGYHKKTKPKKVIFSDNDIIILANIKFISKYYRENPKEVWKIFEVEKRPLYVHEKFFLKHKKHRDKK